jgi:hypothetical protein
MGGQQIIIILLNKSRLRFLSHFNLFLVVILGNSNETSNSVLGMPVKVNQMSLTRQLQDTSKVTK